MDPMLEKGARQGLENMLGFKPGETITIVTDEATMEETQNAFPEVAAQITDHGKVRVRVLEHYGERPLTETPSQIVEDAKASDVTMFVARSLGEELETVRKPFINAAKDAKARHGHCPDFTSRMMSEGMAADYNVVYALSAALNQRLTGAHRVTLTTEVGTNLIVDTLKHFPWHPSKPIARGHSANLPDGEIFCFPYDVNGTAVVDGCLGDFFCELYGSIAENPVSFDIRSGMVLEEGIRCDIPEITYDLELYIFNQDGKREFLTRKVGEFALGTNLAITEPTGNLLQDEKLGNASHLAFGDPLDVHGTGAGYNCKGHLDVLIMNPTVKVDGEIIMDSGQYSEAIMRQALSHAPRGYSLSEDGKSFIAPA